MNKKLYISYFSTFLIFYLYSFIFFRSLILAAIISSIVSLKFYHIIYKFLCKGDVKLKRIMFREFLDIFNTNILTGNNFYNSLKLTSMEIKSIFYDKNFIVKYLDELILEIDNGGNIIDCLTNFKKKCDLEEVDIFIESIIIAVKSGLNISSITNISKDMLTENISIELEISTLVDNSKKEFIIMSILPIIILFMINASSTQVLKLSDYIIRIPVFIVFLIAFYFGDKIVNLEL